MNFRITPCTSRTGTVRSVTGTIRTVTGIARTYPVHSRPINSGRSVIFALFSCPSYLFKLAY